MLLVALTGGLPKQISSVINQAIAQAPSLSGHWKLREEDDTQTRIEFLNRVMAPSRNGARHMFFATIKTVEEARWFEKRNGFIWHVKGRYSDIPKKGERHMFVSPDHHNKAPWLTVEEAVSECLSLQDIFYADQQEAKKIKLIKHR